MEKRARRIESELLAAYETAKYQVDAPEITIKIGEKNPAIDQLLANHRRENWAFITLFNPGSKIIADKENEERLQALKEDLDRFYIYVGHGGGQSKNAPLEKSFLVVGIGIYDANRLGKKYGQDAVVSGKLNAEAQVTLIK